MLRHVVEQLACSLEDEAAHLLTGAGLAALNVQIAPHAILVCELAGQPLQTNRHKALALLVYLAVNPGSHARAALSAFLWPEYSQEKAYAYLRRTIWEIRSLIGEEWLQADRAEAGLRADTKVGLDVAEFLSHLKAFDQHKHLSATLCQECIAHLRAATSKPE